ncbi:hypothetical protein L1887_36500 [Cichorium endivia]|nr:hypothetical protein L1887_36500 [Cichorium endivia]
MGRLHKPFNYLLITLVVFTSSYFHAVSGDDSDKSALLEFKAAVTDPSGVLMSWNLSSSDHCSWIGVTCASDSRVVAINIPLYGFGIAKNCLDLNAKLGMEKLEVIDLEGNLIHGNLQSHFTGSRNLQVLNLGFNQISGEIPNSLSQFKNLQLSGNIPIEIGYNCGNLQHLELAGNLLVGGIPRSLGNCTKLQSLLNSLSGAIPRELGSCLNLSIVVFSNLFNPIPTFSIPDNNFLQLAPKDEFNYFEGENRLTGEFPGVLFENCGKFKGLVVNVSSNGLSGEIPGNIGQTCRILTFLDLSGNRITGKIPVRFGDLGSLVSINLSRNMLTGEISVTFDKIKDLRNLSLSGNKLTGRIPSGLGNVKSLEVLELSENSLSGEIPEALVNLKNLTVLSLNNNKLSGKIPSGLANVKTLQKFNVSFNNLSGPSPSNENLMKCSSLLGNPYLQSCKISPATSSSDQPVSGDFANLSGSPMPGPKGRNGFNSIEIASITSASAIFSVMIALLVLFCCTKWRPKSAGRGHGSARKRFIQERSIRSIDWRVLHKIALDIVRALAYLHDQCVPRVLHHDVKPSNILLDERFQCVFVGFRAREAVGDVGDSRDHGGRGNFRLRGAGVRDDVSGV